MTRTQKLQSSIVDLFLGSAEWRDLKAEDYPGDPRNETSASLIRDLAEYVMRLPGDDSRFEQLADAYMTTGEALGDWSTQSGEGYATHEGQDVVSRLGFGHRVSDSEAFDMFIQAELDELVALRSDANEARIEDELEQILSPICEEIARRQLAYPNELAVDSGRAIVAEIEEGEAS